MVSNVDSRRWFGRVRRALRNPRSGAARPEPLFAYTWVNRILTKALAEQPERLRPDYSWGVLHAGHLAKWLGVPRITVIELGVAGGNGLCALENAAALAERHLPVEIQVIGFDMGVGLPPPLDYRDMPNLYAAGDYAMNVDRLRARLSRADLRLGPVAETIPAFLEEDRGAVGFISFDLDYYSSTVDAMAILRADHQRLLPRVHCYFDDIMGFTCSEFTGERLAISEFNEAHPKRKLSPIFGMKYWVPRKYREESFTEKFYLAHVFDHPLYGAPDGLVYPIATSKLTDLSDERRPPVVVKADG